VKTVAELADRPALCTCDGKVRAGEEDDKTLYYHSSDSLLGFRFNILSVKCFATTVLPGKQITFHFRFMESRDILY
jgi:thymidylate synthase